MMLFTGSRPNGKWTYRLQQMAECWKREERTTLLASQFTRLEDKPCLHQRVTSYFIKVCAETYYFPAEYDWKIVCRDCGEELGDVPDGSDEIQEEWREYPEGDL